MKKVLLYSIKPEYLVNILNGTKTIEIRKRDLPKWAIEALKRGEKVIGYGYCTIAHNKHEELAKQYVGMNPPSLVYAMNHQGVYSAHTFLNGLVVVRFEIDLVILFEFIDGQLCVKADNREQQLRNIYCLNEEATCLTYEQLQGYVGAKIGFAHHLTNITPIEPKTLSEFYREEDIVITEEKNGRKRYSSESNYIQLKNSPQSFMTVWKE